MRLRRWVHTEEYLLPQEIQCQVLATKELNYESMQQQYPPLNVF